ncbi:unnamed protein product, partial [Porites evermanni]
LDLVKDIRDPELPQTLEELSVIEEEFIKIHETGNDEYIIKIEFKPTAPHCSLATLIAQSMWQKFEGSFLLQQTGQSPNDIIQMIKRTLTDNPHHNTKCEPTVMVFDDTKNNC